MQQRTFGAKRLRHPVVGELTVQFETLTLPGDRDQTLFLYTTEAGTASREAMDLLASSALGARRSALGARRSALGATVAPPKAIAEP